jgi:hypothetical protein
VGGAVNKEEEMLKRGVRCVKVRDFCEGEGNR